MNQNQASESSLLGGNTPGGSEYNPTFGGGRNPKPRRGVMDSQASAATANDPVGQLYGGKRNGKVFVQNNSPLASHADPPQDLRAARKDRAKKKEEVKEEAKQLNNDFLDALDNIAEN